MLYSRRVLLLGSVLLLLGLASCGGVPLHDILNAREVTSCIYTQGNAAPYASVRTITATGGATLQQCSDLR